MIDWMNIYMNYADNNPYNYFNHLNQNKGWQQNTIFYALCFRWFTSKLGVNDNTKDSNGKFEMQLELLLCKNLKSKKPTSAQLHNN
jgi:hypothetical protein